jgi:hypothetical protein
VISGLVTILMDAALSTRICTMVRWSGPTLTRHLIASHRRLPKFLLLLYAVSRLDSGRDARISVRDRAGPGNQAHSLCSRVGQQNRYVSHSSSSRRLADGEDFANKQVEVEPALPPIEDASVAPPPDPNQHNQTLPEEKRMKMYNLEYDQLVISVGCYSASFGIPGVSRHPFHKVDADW